MFAKVFALVGGMEGGKLLLLYSEREGALFQGSLCSPLRSGGFVCKSICTSKEYGERETSLVLLTSEKGWFLLCAPVGDM